MRTQHFGRHTVTTYETIDELPIDRFTAWNKYMMIDGSIGSTFEDIDRMHLSQLAMVIDNKDKAMQQVSNLRELVFNLVNQVNYAHHAYCCLVHSIDGVPVTDYSDTGIKDILARLAKIGVSNGTVKKKIPIAKRLFTTLWNAYFRISLTGRRSTITGRRSRNGAN